MSKAEARSRDWREWRRFRAAELHEEGWTGQEIAVALGVSTGAVSQWLKRLRVGGKEALRAKPPPGPTPRLTPAQRAELPAGRDSDRTGVWGPLSPGSCGPAAAGGRMVGAEARDAGHATR